MRKNVFIALLISFCLFYSGCFAPYLLVAGLGAVGATAVSDDAIQGDTDQGFNKLWNSALKVTRIMGSIETEDGSKGIIEGAVDESKVKITLEQLTPKTTRMRVAARKHLLPDRKLAQKMYLKILENAK